VREADPNMSIDRGGGMERMERVDPAHVPGFSLGLQPPRLSASRPSKIRKIGDGSGVDQVVVLQISRDPAHPRVLRRTIGTGHFGE
jgi:hypothetical protein